MVVNAVVSIVFVVVVYLCSFCVAVEMQSPQSIKISYFEQRRNVH